MEEYPEAIRVTDQEAHAMVRELAKSDVRSIGGQVAWLIRQEYARRYSQPNELITIESALEAAAALKAAAYEAQGPTDDEDRPRRSDFIGI